MDLLQTVRKEGSRGGRDEFKWDDVKNSQHRENYLGHSLMAPVGRWQTGKDLNWYAKTDSIKTNDGEGKSEAELAAEARREEIRRIKEAEEDARAVALGLPPPVRNNPNLEPVAEKEGATRKIQGPEPEKRRHRDRSRSRERKHSRRHREGSRDREDRRRRRRDRSRSRSRDNTQERSHRRRRSRSVEDPTRDSTRRHSRREDRSRSRDAPKRYRDRSRSPHDRGTRRRSRERSLDYERRKD